MSQRIYRLREELLLVNFGISASRPKPRIASNCFLKFDFIFDTSIFLDWTVRYLILIYICNPNSDIHNGRLVPVSLPSTPAKENGKKIKMNYLNCHSYVLVTGATGLIGAHVVDNLLSKGIKVRAVARSKDKATAFLSERPVHAANLDFFFINDLTDENAFDDAVKEVDEVIHIASVGIR